MDGTLKNSSRGLRTVLAYGTWETRLFAGGIAGSPLSFVDIPKWILLFLVPPIIDVRYY